MNKLIPDTETLKESFNTVKGKNTLIDRECALLQEASRFDMPLEKYEKLFELYIKDKIDEQIVYYPSINAKKWKSTLNLWRQWFSSQSKLKLLTMILTVLLEKGAILSVGIAAIQYMINIPQRTKQAETQKIQAHYQAWNIINSAVGKDSTNGARIEALQALNADKVNMDGVNLEGASLLHINLRNAKLETANFKNANLYHADFQMANLRGAFFQQKANLNDANLKQAYLSGADFTSTYLKKANLEKAKLDAAIFQKADLRGAKLKDAELCGTTFNNKYLCADFRGAKNLTVQQIKSAKDWEKADYDPEMRSQLGLLPETPPTNKSTK